MLAVSNFTVWNPFLYPSTFINLYFDVTFIWWFTLASIFWNAKVHVGSSLWPCLYNRLALQAQIKIRLRNLHVWKLFSWSFSPPTLILLWSLFEKLCTRGSGQLTTYNWRQIPSFTKITCVCASQEIPHLKICHCIVKPLNCANVNKVITTLNQASKVPGTRRK